MSTRHVTAGRLGGYVRWSRTTDRAAGTAAARQAAEDRWLRQVRAEFPDVDDKTARLMADAKKRAYFTRLGIKSAAARAAKRRGRAA
jgi:hypothetical protein